MTNRRARTVKVTDNHGGVHRFPIKEIDPVQEPVKRKPSMIATVFGSLAFLLLMTAVVLVAVIAVVALVWVLLFVLAQITALLAVVG